MATTEIGSINFPRDSTLQEILAAQNVTNAHLAVIAAESTAVISASYAAIRNIVQQGLGESVFPIGTQIMVNWTDSVSGTTYEWPFDVVHFDDVELEDGETTPGMFLQAHYCSPFGIPFDAREAFYYASDGLSAGTYYFTVGDTTWGKFVKGNIFEFTLESDVDAGSQLYFASDLYSNSPDGTTINVYASATATEATQTATLALVDSSEGTDLGTITRGFDGNMGSFQTATYGYNRWSASAMRQYLNSPAAIGKWWSAQSNFDRPPATELAKYPGFMSGFDSDFLSIIQPVKVTTALNTVSDSGDGTSEDTYDRFFLASLEQQYITPQLSGVEGDYWEYWKRAAGATETIKTGVIGAFPLTYAINAKTSAQIVRLRSARRSTAYYVWLVGSAGGVYGYYGATDAHRFSPACVVC